MVHSNIIVTNGGRTTKTGSTFKKLLSATGSNSRTLYRTDTKTNWNEDEMAAMNAEIQFAQRHDGEAEAERAEFTRLKREKLAAQMDRNAGLVHTLKRVVTTLKRVV